MILEPQGVKSLIVIPLIKNDELYGFLGFDSVKEKRIYNMFEQDVLREFSNVLINALKRHDTDLELENQKVRTEFLFESTNIGAWEWDLLTNEIKINKVWATMAGYKLDDFDHPTIDTWRSIANPTDLIESTKKLEAVISGKREIYEAEVRIKHKKGHDVWIKDIGKIISYENGIPRILQGAHIDISEIKEKENKLKVITQAIDYSPLSVVITDKEGITQYVNPKFCEISGYEITDVLNKKFNKLRSGYHDKHFYENMWQTILSGKTWQGQIYNKKKDGSFYWEDTSISPVFDEYNEITNFVAIKNDITEKKELDQTLAKKRVSLEVEVDEKIAEIIEAQKASIIALAKLTESRDYDTGKHIERVQFLSKALATQLKENDKFKTVIDKKFIDDIFYASALHDLGKIKISDQILLKPGKLSVGEFNEMKNHVTYGAEILLEMVRNYPRSSIFIMGVTIAKYHHEKYDGSGYGEGLKGDDIPIEARIMALVDVYDALRSKRAYKEAFKHQKVCELIFADRGTHFDPDVVDAFIKIQQQFEMIFDSLN
ncbi:MAG TPA: PAS domain S-box protein [Acholeplasma sp.]|nr:PAS domain S-box protein [Acholeplasma sp.]